MRTIRLMFLRTFGALRRSLAAITAVGAFLLLSGGFFVRALARGDGGSMPVAALWALSAAPFLPMLAALLTMRLLADERADGRLDLLLASPVRERDLVLGKFLGAFVLVGTAVAVYLLMPLVVLPRCAPMLAERLSPLVFLPAVAALLMQSATWCAFGLCASAWCRQAAVAAVMTLLLVLALPHAVFRAGTAWSPVLRAQFAEMPLEAHLVDLSTGLFGTATLVFYLVLTCFGLFAATKAVAAMRFRGRAAFGARAATVFVVMLAAIFTCCVIALSVRLDMSFELPFRSAEAETSARTRQILAETHGEVRVTCFLAGKAPEHRAVARLLRGLAAAARKVSGMRLEVDWADPRWDLGKASRLVRRGTPEGTLVFSRGQRRLEVPVASLFATTNGELRVTAGGVFVGEEVCAGALQRLARPVPHEKVFWTTGHGESSFDSYDAATGMSDIARELRRDGYQLATLNLTEQVAVPDDCAVLVVAGAREPFSRVERTQVQGYLATGGRLLVLASGDPNAGVGPLLADWGVKLLPFTAVSPRTLTGADVVVTEFADHRITSPLEGCAVLFEDGTPLAPTEGHGDSTFTALARTDAAAWGESDVAARPWTFDPSLEPRGPLVLAAALERGGAAAKDLALRPARIVVIGDAAFVSNGPLATRANANRDFFLNALAWLAGLDTLTAVRTPGNVVVTGLDRTGWMRFGAWSAALMMLVVGTAALAAVFRRR